MRDFVWDYTYCPVILNTLCMLNAYSLAESYQDLISKYGLQPDFYRPPTMKSYGETIL